MKKITTILLVTSLLIISARGQGFLNLNFESAYNLTNNPANDGVLVSVTNALPSWTAYDGDNALADIYYVTNFLNIFHGSVDLVGGSPALSGNFSVGLSSDSSLSQTAQVPSNAESLEFETISAAGLELYLDGQIISIKEISADNGYNTYGANLPAGTAGQVETLTFFEDGSQTVLDDIVFLPTPEPGEGALLGLGTLVWGVYWRTRRTERRKH